MIPPILIFEILFGVATLAFIAFLFGYAAALDRIKHDQKHQKEVQ